MASDGRDWHSYNEALVRGGELNLDSSVMEEWKRELKKENEGKVGEPYQPLSRVVRQAHRFRQAPLAPALQADRGVRALPLQVRGGAGCRSLTDYSTINRRVNGLHVDLDESLIKSNRPVSIAVDASGVKVHNGGDWIRRVWKVKKGYLKIHFAVGIKTGQVVSMNVSSEKVGDGKRLVKRVLADGAFDSKANFN